MRCKLGALPLGTAQVCCMLGSTLVSMTDLPEPFPALMKLDEVSSMGAMIEARDKAEAWADEDEDIEVETDKYSAKHWSAKHEMRCLRSEDDWMGELWWQNLMNRQAFNSLRVNSAVQRLHAYTIL